MMRRGLFHRLGLGIRSQKSNGQTLSFLYEALETAETGAAQGRVSGVDGDWLAGLWRFGLQPLWRLCEVYGCSWNH
jgi:hypothetical protein